MIYVSPRSTLTSPVSVYLCSLPRTGGRKEHIVPGGRGVPRGGGDCSTIFERIGEEGGMGWDLAHVIIDLVDSFNHPTSLAL